MKGARRGALQYGLHSRHALPKMACMKSAFVALYLGVAVLGCGSGGDSTRYVLRVDETLASRNGIQFPTNAIPDDHYAPVAPSDRYEVAFDGDHVKITTLGTSSVRELQGTLSWSRVGEKKYHLDNTFAGGMFVVNGERGELTIFGSGVPVVLSERGQLIEQ